MLKITALNEDSDDDAKAEVEVTKEAVEQLALQQYNKALELHRDGSVGDSLQLLKDLLQTEVLHGVAKPALGEKVTTPLLNLKYLCYKNIAAMLGVVGDLAAGIHAYNSAVEIDDTDVTLWHRLGVLCMRAQRYDEALEAFRRGVQLRPHHWPCLDRILTLLLGLHLPEECVELCYETLELDPGYQRALVYRSHIYKTYPYVLTYMRNISPKYMWKNKEEIDPVIAQPLLAEAFKIKEYYAQFRKDNVFKPGLPNLQITVHELSWLSVGSALVEMHEFMANNHYSHACHIKVNFDHEDIETSQKSETLAKQGEIGMLKKSSTENTLQHQVNATNISDNKKPEEISPEKLDGETEPSSIPAPADVPRRQRRCRGNDVGLLQQWEWYYKRQPRKNQAARPDRFDHTVYHMLRSILPPSLTRADLSDATESEPAPQAAESRHVQPHHEYFHSPDERADVKRFLLNYALPTNDIIDILKEYLYIMCFKWKMLWPAGLAAVFVEAHECHRSHVFEPQQSALDTYLDEHRRYVAVTLMAEELAVNAKMHERQRNPKVGTEHDASAMKALYMSLRSTLKFSTPFTMQELYIRFVWVHVHVSLLNGNDAMALEYLSSLAHEFHDTSCDQLEISNFTYKPKVNLQEIQAYCRFLERNEKLASVPDIYDHGLYSEALRILIDSFDYCKNMTRQQEDELSLNFATQLMVLVLCCWQERRRNDCFKWSLTCLHEALKHYFRYTSGSPEYSLWSQTVSNILEVMEQVLATQNPMYLEAVTQSDLSQGVEDLIRIVGHQVESAGSDMPLGTVSPWIIMHYILQREEDHGRGRVAKEPDDVPDPMIILFLGHEQLGERGWCCQCNAKLIFFIMDSVVSRLQAPALARCRKYVVEYLEQCVYCLYGHPGRKKKVKYLADHSTTPRTLDWERAQQVYEIFCPALLPALEGKSGITADTEQLFHRILELLPPSIDPRQHTASVDRYIRGIDSKLPANTVSLPFKMRDIYFLLGDYYFKKEEHKLAIEYNMLDVIINRDRLESWAEISLAKAVNLQRLLNSCKNIDNEKEFLNPAKCIIRCFKRTLQLEPTHCNMLIEYGMFVYAVHSFCSRLLKQASESLSMDDFEALERQKQDMLQITHKCFKTVLRDMQSTNDSDNEDAWLHFYMLGKVAEKRNRPPDEYLDYYMRGVRSLHEANASYPQKINYCSPANQCIQVLELHYRIHATILKYIEQHENRPIPLSVGKVFTACIDEWKNGPFVNKKLNKVDSRVQAANIQKRSVSDTGATNYPAAKKIKMESSAAKIKRSVSYDPETLLKAPSSEAKVTSSSIKPTVTLPTIGEDDDFEVRERASTARGNTNKTKGGNKQPRGRKNSDSTSGSSYSSSGSSSSGSSASSSSDSSAAAPADPPLTAAQRADIAAACLDALEDCACRFPPHYKAIYRLAHYHFYNSRGKDIERCRDLMLSNFKSRSGQKLNGLFGERKASNFFNNIWKIPVEEVERAGGFAFHMSRCVLLSMEILKEIDDHKTLLDLSLHLQRIPQADKKYLRDSDREELAQQALSLCLQSLKGQLCKFSQQADLRSNEVERNVFDTMMLDIYRYYQKTQKQPSAKQFTSLLVDAYKLIKPTIVPDTANLVDLSMKHCQAHIQALKQQAAQASRERSQNAQRKQTAKTAIAAPTRGVKRKAASNALPQTPPTKRKVTPPAVKAATQAASNIPPTPPMRDAKARAKARFKAEMAKAQAKKSKAQASKASRSASQQPPGTNSEFKTPHVPAPAPPGTATLHNYMPMLNAPGPSSALSYLSNMGTLHSYTQSLQASMQTTLQNSFEAEFYRQLLTQSMSSFNVQPPPDKKQKRGPKPKKVTQEPLAPPRPTDVSGKLVTSKVTKQQASIVTKQPMSAPSMGTVLSRLPPSMASLSSGSQPTSASALLSAPPAHQKTLQEKLAERQKSSQSVALATTSSLKAVRRKKPDASKALPSNTSGKRPKKPSASDEIIVLDD